MKTKFTIATILMGYWPYSGNTQNHDKSASSNSTVVESVFKADWLVGQWQSIKPVGYTLEFINRKPILQTSHTIDPWGEFTFTVDSTGTVNPKGWAGGWPPIYFEVKRIGDDEIEALCYQFGYGPSDELKIVYKKLKK